MDRATVIGIVAVFAVLIIGMAMGGSLKPFWDPASIFITLGGCLMATLMSYSLETFIEVIKVAKAAFTSKNADLHQIVDTLVEFADKTRREGLLSLDKQVDDIEDPFLQKGLRLIIDGTTQDLVRNILETEVYCIAERHKTGQAVFETLGSFAPAFGMIGTLIGLVQMLLVLDSPEKIGPGMAVALVTTFYGTVLANMVFLPLANKLKNQSQQEITVKEAVIEGVLSIQSGDNPRLIREKLEVFVSPKKRELLSDPASRRKGAVEDGQAIRS